MNSGERLAGLWGALFPIAAVVLFSVILGFTGRGAAPAGQTAAAGQSPAQSAGSPAVGSTAPAAMTGGTSAPAATTATAASGSAATPAASTSGAAAATTGASATPAQAPADGTQVYNGNCASCHGPAGAGVAGAFPPLAGNKAILGSDKYVSDVLLYGLQGQINAGGQNYNGVMPAWAATLSDAQIAAVLTHIRSSWGNSAPAVTAATVKTERASTMTAAQVLTERPQ